MSRNTRHPRFCFINVISRGRGEMKKQMTLQTWARFKPTTQKSATNNTSSSGGRVAHDPAAQHMMRLPSVNFYLVLLITLLTVNCIITICGDMYYKMWLQK